MAGKKAKAVEGTPRPVVKILRDVSSAAMRLFGQWGRGDRGAQLIAELRELLDEAEPAIAARVKLKEATRKAGEDAAKAAKEKHRPYRRTVDSRGNAVADAPPEAAPSEDGES